MKKKSKIFIVINMSPDNEIMIATKTRKRAKKYIKDSFEDFDLDKDLIDDVAIEEVDYIPE